MAKAVLATGKDLKRVRVFLGKDGQKYEGSIADYNTNPKILRDNVGGTSEADRLPGEPEEVEKEEKE